MSGTLLDTNVLSELVRPKPEPRVLAFVRTATDPYISALTLHEIAYGAERAPDPVRRAKLTSWLGSMRRKFEDRIIVLDADIAEHGGRLRAAADAAGSPSDPLDALIAACALSRGLAIATRNIRHFAGFGVDLIDPWKS
ncbi:MAG: type II toxin-antitoxin system VapC family toxin [Terricaulis sp.]